MAGLKSISKKRTKKKFVARARHGIAAIPVEKGFESVKYYFHLEVEKKHLAESLKTWLKNNYSKDDLKAIMANPDYKFTLYTHYCATAFWINTGQPMCEKATYYENCLKRFGGELLENGKKILSEKKLEDETKAKNVITLSPQQKLERKIARTIMIDLDNLEDSWIEGEKADIDVYTLFKKHGLSGSATIPVKTLVEGWLLDYEDAYHKRCEQAVEGYSHVKRPELNRRIKVCQQILSDLERIKAAAKATRTVRIKKPQSIEKQVRSVKYKKECKDFKLASISPVQIIGKKRLFVFNTKYKALAEYITDDPKGFIISGTSIKNFDKEQSRSAALRKPDDILPDILKKTPKQIDQIWKGLTTKINIPNGRLNADTIILRVVER